jgi:signal transduction histidine kinase
MKISYKIVLLIIIVSIIPVFLISYSAFKHSQFIIEDMAEKHLKSLSNNKYNSFMLWLDESRQILESFSQSQTAVRILRSEEKIEENKKALNQVFLNGVAGKRFNEIYLLNPDNTKIKKCFNSDSADFSESACLYYDKNSEKPVMAIFIPVSLVEEDLVLAAEIDLDYLSEKIIQTSGKDFYEKVYIMSKENFVVTHAGTEEKNKSFAKPEIQISNLAGPDKLLFTGEFKSSTGKIMTGVLRWIPQISGYLVVETSSKRLYSPVYSIKKNVAIQAVFVSILAFLFAGLISYFIKKPLDKIIQATKDIGSGNFNIKSLKKGNNEISELAVNIEKMAVKLENTMVGKESLEKEVKERRKTEKQLKKTLTELRRSNQDLQQFAYVASHDLQEPLRMISSYTQLLSHMYKGKLDEKADKYIYYAVDGAQRMQRLIEDLLSFSRVNTHGGELKKTDLNKCYEYAFKNLEISIKESSAEISCESLPLVWGDETQLTLLLQNLISNAIKFCKERKPEIKIKTERNDNLWTVSVHDNGIGIEEKHLDRIFVIFQRLHSKSEYQGTGIGLAVCKQIVERHGGEIFCKSEPLDGSVFYFTIPAIEGGQNE